MSSSETFVWCMAAWWAVKAVVRLTRHATLWSKPTIKLETHNGYDIAANLVVAVVYVLAVLAGLGKVV